MNAFPNFITELNVLNKDKGKNFGFIYPGKYNIGMTGMTISTLSNIVNSCSSWQFERFFLPWNPSISPLSVEHKISLLKMDVIGFTSQFELDYLVVCWLLKKEGIPLDNQKRKALSGKYPPIIVGGPCSGANPFPLLDLVDGYFLGDAENSLPLFLRNLDEFGIQGLWDDPDAFMSIPGFWSPHFLDLQNNNAYSELFHERPFHEVAGKWSSKFDFVDLNKSTYPVKQIITNLPDYHPYSPFKGQTFQLELGRGCKHSCKFCMIGSGMFSPTRYRSLSKLREIVEEGTKATGVTKIDIFGTNLSDFPQLGELCWELVNQGLSISIATLRPDKVSPEIVQALIKGGQTNLTIAPETGTDQLRKILGKRVTNEQILNATSIIFETGISTLKNFFLTGLPNETEDDRNALIGLVKKQQQIALNSNIEKPLIRVDVNPFVPKWQTPMKNWVFYYLPNNRTLLQQILNKYYVSFKKMEKIRPKQTSFIEFLGQTWLTHIVEPINNFAKNMPLDTHIPISRNGPFYLQKFKNRLDDVLINTWSEFERSNWQVNHKVHSTNHSDEYFTKQYQKIIHYDLT